MTAPRQVLRGISYLVSRRCSERRFLLKPSRLTNEVFLYVLAVAATRYDIQVHAYCVLSNHFHFVVTDPNARLPAFHQFLDALVARALNASWGRWDAFWDPSSYSAVALTSPADIVDKTAYVLANPVAARLVRSARAWPGLWSAPELIGGEAIEVKRPKHFFDPKGALPEKLTLKLTPPPAFSSAEEFRAQVEVALAEREARAVREAGVRGFVGAARVLAQKPTDAPKGGEPRRRLNPRIAARDKWKRVEALGRLVEFLRAYREALASRRAGNTDTIFPCGTYLMRVAHDVPCAGFG
jgi:putative transposase